VSTEARWAYTLLIRRRRIPEKTTGRNSFIGGGGQLTGLGMRKGEEIFLTKMDGMFYFSGEPFQRGKPNWGREAANRLIEKKASH